MGWTQQNKFWLNPGHWHQVQKKQKKTRQYHVCDCGNWCWEDRKPLKCYGCGSPTDGGSPPARTQSGSPDKPTMEPPPSAEPLLPLIEAMGQQPDLQPYVALLQQLVPRAAAAHTGRAGWQESKQRVQKANLDVQKLEGTQKRLEDNIKHWQEKLEAAQKELKDTKESLGKAYTEQEEAQLEKRTILERGDDDPTRDSGDVPDEGEAAMAANGDARPAAAAAATGSQGQEERELEEAKRAFEAAQQRVDKKKRANELLKVDPAALARAAKQVAEDVAAKRAKTSDGKKDDDEVPVDQDGDAAMGGAAQGP